MCLSSRAFALKVRGPKKHLKNKNKYKSHIFQRKTTTEAINPILLTDVVTKKNPYHESFFCISSYFVLPTRLLTQAL